MATGDTQTTSAPSAGGLGYSRHYAQRIRDLGQTSKDSWITRLWNHVFGSSAASSKKLSVKADDAACSGSGSCVSPGRPGDHVDDQSSPSDSSSHGQLTDMSDARKLQQVSNSDRLDVPAVTAVQRQSRPTHEVAGRPMPPQLVNSPYLPSKEKVVYYRPALTAHAGGRTRDGVMAAKLRYDRLSKSTTTLRSSSDSSVDARQELRKSTSLFPVKRQFKRDSGVILMEKRAKAVADRAILVCINL